jgi:AcrR family transcriptional regulator
MAYDVSRPIALSLAARHSDLTERAILESAVQLLERSSLTELTARAVAKQAAISERTVFRYFPSRDEFLDAVAGEVRTALNVPPPPRSLAELYAAPRGLYGAFEARTNLTKAALHTELFDRMRETQAKDRWSAVRKLVDAYAARRPERERKIAAANIRYYLSATTWHYYRFYFGFSLEDAITCAEVSIRQSVAALAPRR